MKIDPIFILMPFGIPALVWTYYSNGGFDPTERPPTGVDQRNDTKANPKPNCTAETTQPDWSIERLQDVPYDVWPAASCMLRGRGNQSLRGLISVHSPDMFNAASRGLIGFLQYYVATDGPKKLCEGETHNHHRRTPVQIAIAHHHLNILRYVATIKTLNRVDCLLNEVYTSTHLTDKFKLKVYRSAVRSGDLAVLKYLVEEKNVYTLELNERDDITGLLKLVGLTAHGANIEYYRAEAKEQNIEVNKFIQSRLINHAAISGHMNAMGFLVRTLKFNVDLPDEYGWTPAHCAAFWGASAMLVYLVDVEGANVNILTVIGNTLLHTAASNHGTVYVIEYLIGDKGLNVNAKNYLDQTPIYFAVWNGRLDLVVHLSANRKADLYVRDGANNRNLLHRAAFSGHLDILKYLIDDMNMTSLINETERYGYTAAMNAARCMVRGQGLPILRYLVEEKGASLEGVDERGLDILMIAANEKMMSIVRYLIVVKGFDPHKICSEGDPVYVGKSAFDLLKDITGVDADSRWFRDYVKATASHRHG